MRYQMGLLLSFCWAWSVTAQVQPELMQAIAAHYYANERAVAKGRWHHLYLLDEVSTLPQPIAESMLKAHPQRLAQLKKLQLPMGIQGNWNDWISAYPESLRKKINLPYSVEQFHHMLAQRTTQHPYLLVVFTPYRISETEYLAIVRHFRNSEHQKEEMALWKKVNGSWVYSQQLYFFKP